MKKLNNNRICIGKIINTHGIRGELKIDPYTHDLQRFSKIDKLYIGQNNEFFTIEKARNDHRFVYLTLHSYYNINDVLHLKNQLIFISEEERLPLPEDTYYIFDFIGKSVMDESNQVIGQVVDIIENPANDILVVLTPSKEEILIPFVKEFIKNISDSIQVSLIEGMRK